MRNCFLKYICLRLESVLSVVLALISLSEEVSETLIYLLYGTVSLEDITS